jgi:aminopeptidase
VGRFRRLADVLVGYSTKVQPGDKVLLATGVDVPIEMNAAIFDAVLEAGGVNLEPILLDQELLAASLLGTNRAALAVDEEAHLVRVKGCDVWIGLRSRGNVCEMASVPPAEMALYQKAMEPSLRLRADHRRWVLTGFPTKSFAQLCGLPTPHARNFFFNAVFADYPAMAEAVKPLVELMERTDQVRINGPGPTDISFSIKGIPVIPCTGELNIPDGESFTAPVKDSVNGTIFYNTLSIARSGDRFEGITFTIENGRIVRESCASGDSARLTAILDTDEGSRSFGEFSLGLNWGITRIIGDTLFDEKVGGTFHFTPGNAYEKAPNGNKSAVHWDLVCDQRKQSGGGEMWFDDVLIRKDGVFIPEELHGLNPKV